MADFDLAVIGAGTIGAAIARDAAGRGIKTILLDEGDLASDASAGAAMLVRSALQSRRGLLRAWRAALVEREVMLAVAPHLVRVQPLVVIPPESARSAIALRARLFAYDHLAMRRIVPATRTLDLTHHPFGTALRRHFDVGFACSDCRVDEVRLPFGYARDAADRGAAIRPRTRCLRAERGEDWTLVINARGLRQSLAVRVLVNADTLTGEGGRPFPGAPSVALHRVMETYVVGPRTFEHEGGYLLPDRMGGYVFALPFDGESMLLGPIEKTYSGAAVCAPTAGDIAALCALATHYFRRPLPLDAVSAFARLQVTAARGGRPMPPGPDHVLHLDKPHGLAPLLTVFGGSAIVARRLAEAALDRLARFFAGGPAWTRSVPVCGGDFAAGVDEFVAETMRRWPFLGARQARRLVSSYGTRVGRVLGPPTQESDLGERFGADLTAAEVGYLMAEEWAETADDILCRRSTLGLGVRAEARTALARFMAARSRRGSAEDFH